MKRDACQEVVRKLDELILNHGVENPELLKNLLECRKDLEAALSKKDKMDLSKVLLRIYSAARFFKDCWEFFDPD